MKNNKTDIGLIFIFLIVLFIFFDISSNQRTTESGEQKILCFPRIDGGEICAPNLEKNS